MNATGIVRSGSSHSVKSYNHSGPSYDHSGSNTSADTFIVFDADYGPISSLSGSQEAVYPPIRHSQDGRQDGRRSPTGSIADEDVEHDAADVDELDGDGSTTLNKGSGGRGGWRMLGGPSGSRFEPLTWGELVGMTISALAVAGTTALALGVVLSPVVGAFGDMAS